MKKNEIENSEILKLREKGMSFPKIARALGTSRELVRERMKRIGILKSVPDHNPLANFKYSYNYDFFNKIDTQEKAYILGILYADGNNFSKYKKRISIGLHKNDKELLEKISQILNSNRPLQYSQNSYILHISGKNISEQLTNLGCVPQKSLILKFPTEEQVPRELHSHFIRGYFDGDGCISYGKCYRVVAILGTEDFIQGVKYCLEENGIPSKISKVKNIFILRIYSKDNIKSFHDYIYKNANIFMERKNNKFIEYFKTL